MAAMPAPHALLSPSAAQRWLRCPRAPHMEAELPEETTPEAEEGTRAHQLAARMVEAYASARNISATDDEAGPEMRRATGAYLQLVMEEAMSYPVRPAIQAELQVPLDRWAPESYGTADCVIIGSGRLTVIDYKHGKGVPVSAAGNPQTRLYALGVLDYYGRYGMADDITEVKLTICQPRLDNTTSEHMTVQDLLAWGESIKAAAQRARAGDGPCVTGDWCQFCAARGACRAWACKVAGLLPQTARDPGVMTPEEIAAVLPKAAGVKTWIDKLEEYAAKLAARGRTIPGYKLVTTLGRRAWTDVDAALTAAEAAGVDRALLYETRPVTLSALEGIMGRRAFEQALGGYVTRPAGNPKLVPDSHPGAAITPAASDFAHFKNQSL